MINIGQRVFFSTGRGSYGYASVRAIANGLAFLDPEPSAHKGKDCIESDRGEKWLPRDRGIPVANKTLRDLNFPPHYILSV